MAAALLARLQDDLTAARKAQDKAQVLLLGTILADARNREIELKRDLADEDVVEVLRRGVKKRRESVDMYDKGGRTDLAAIERAESFRHWPAPRLGDERGVHLQIGVAQVVQDPAPQRYDPVAGDAQQGGDIGGGVALDLGVPQHGP